MLTGCCLPRNNVNHDLEHGTFMGTSMRGGHRDCFEMLEFEVGTGAEQSMCQKVKFNVFACRVLRRGFEG